MTRPGHVWLLRLATATFAASLMLWTNSARAGLQTAMSNALNFMRFAQSDLPRTFVGPEAGNDADLERSDRPELQYDPQTGNLVLDVPAAVVVAGEPGWDYARLYYFSKATFASGLTLPASQSPSQTALWWNGWGRNSGPLHEVFVPEGLSLFDGSRFSYPSTDTWDATAISAARVDFGDVLPSGLSLSQLQLALNAQSTMVGTVDYRPAYGGPMFQVPITLGIVPEPRVAMPMVLAALAVIAARSARRR